MEASAIGRDTVLDQAWRALGAPGWALIEGPAGIGKTVVWRSLVSRAERAGWRVLTCAPNESEVDLPLAALADLLRPLADAVASLPRPQRIAAEAVLLLSDVDEPLDERALGAATRSMLDVAAAEPAGRPVLVAVDDAAWLDPPSERALRFALRRAGPRVAVLATCRTTGPGLPVVPLGLDQGPRASQLVRIGLEPLGVGALHHLLRNRLGTTLSRPLLARVARDAAGNPLLAIELARAIMRLPRLPRPGEDLPIASSMHDVLAGAWATLPTASRDAVRLASLLAVPTLRDLMAAGVRPMAFDAAEEAGLLAVRSAVIEFAHPLHANAVRAGIPPGVRLRLHETLAEVVSDPTERARHLARCTFRPDAGVAAELASAAQRQRARGAPELAADMYERAAELTPPQAAADRGLRLLAAVRCRLESVDYAAAATAADAAAEELTGDLRAEAFLLRAIVAWNASDYSDAPVLAAERGLAAATAGSRLAGRIHAHLALFHDTPDSARRHAEAARSLLTGSEGDRALLSAALLLLLFHEVRAGRPARTELLEQGLALEDGEPSWLAGTVPAIWWKGIDDHHRARSRLHEMLDRASARGDEPLEQELLTHLGETELLAGCWAAAEEHIIGARDLGEQLGAGLAAPTWLSGLLQAHRGELAEASTVAEAGLRRADEAGDAWYRRISLQLTGFVALSAGRMDEAASAYGALAAAADAVGLVEALPLRFEPDWIEACVGAGDLRTAKVALDRLADRHKRLARPWTTLGLARSRALLSSAMGEDPVAALEELAAARLAVPAGVLPLDRARCLLVAGVIHRRARRKREAREALTVAAEEFGRLGASAFEDRARAELARIGGRPPAPQQLTVTEQQVAELAAQGRTNRVIADALFLSPKTVEANLARVYRKLGISTRAELGATMANRSSGH